jgi:DNA-binding transcriptional ArsR family regulator
MVAKRRLRNHGAVAENDPDWISVSDLAKQRGVSHQAISKRLRSLTERGQLPTRRSGRVTLIHAPSFEALTEAVHDPAQDLRNRNVGRHADAAAASEGFFEKEPQPQSSDDAKPAPQPSKFNDAAAREKDAKAALAEMQLAQKRGELVPKQDIEKAAISCWEKVHSRISALKSLSGRLYAAARGGEEGLHVEHSRQIDEALALIGDDLRKLADEASPTT